MAGEENPRAGARGARHARCAKWGERTAHALLACVLMDCQAPPTLRKLHPPVFWWISLCMQPLPSLAPPVGLAGCGYRKVADAPPSLASSEALPRRPDGGYAHKGLRPEVGRGPLWRVSNPFATQPSQPRQKAVNCYGPTTYSARVPTCRLRTTADAVYVTVHLRYRTCVIQYLQYCILKVVEL